MERYALIIDDDRTERRMVAGTLRRGLSLQAKEAENGKDGLRILESCRDDKVALIVLDMDMPIMNGIQTLGEIAKNYAHVPVIMLTGNTDPENREKAMRLGAIDYLSKPLEPARLELTARNALRLSTMKAEINRLQRKSAGAVLFSDMIGHDRGMRDVVRVGTKAASCDLPVLVSGETGTGKEMFSRAVHGEGKRHDRPFVAINCGAIPEKLIESTLFGHEKGAFTGATNKATGKFQEAHTGTIFLDEIGELPLEAQVKLLRVLQEGEVEPVGASKPVKVDVHVVSATNRDLRADVMSGRFREDLFYRLNVLHVELPSLRQRQDDLELLADSFIGRYCDRHQVIPKKISPQALEKMKSYTWPGNVRELENSVSRAMALSEGEFLEGEDFVFSHMSGILSTGENKHSISLIDADGNLKSFKDIEAEIASKALRHHNNNMTQTAKALGIAKTTLYAKVARC